jgi:hypothetical protein
MVEKKNSWLRDLGLAALLSAGALGVWYGANSVEGRSAVSEKPVEESPAKYVSVGLACAALLGGTYYVIRKVK